MENFLLALTFFQKTLSAVGPFVLLLGVLIFIHELGHFLVARWFQVKVEVFSLGFGPKILKYKKGDTLYCISIFPLGGYVKMFGDNPLEEIPDSEKSQGFLYKKVYQKWLIAFAGPFFNLMFTLLAFFLIAKIGVPSLPAQLGDISKDSLAYQVGFRSGDEILSVNGNKISYYEDMAELVKKTKEKELSFEVKPEKDQIKNIVAPVTTIKNPNPIDRDKQIGAIAGLTVVSKSLKTGVRFNSLAYQKGFRTFDKILEINGKPVRYWRELEALIASQVNNKFKVQTVSESKILYLESNSIQTAVELGLEPSFLYIQKVGTNTPAKKAGLKKGDRLHAIDGKTLKSWEQVLNTIKNTTGEPLSLTYQRETELKTLSITPKSLFVEGNIKNRYMLGIVSGGGSVFPSEILRQRKLLESFAYSGAETYKWLRFIITGLVRMVQGEISLRSMGGPIAIGRIAHSSFSEGFISFLFMMALISLNLFFINLLPIPVLDGGHLLFFTLEGILGRPLSVKKLIFAQSIGLVFLLSFMGFAVFNDIYNWLKAW